MGKKRECVNRIKAALAFSEGEPVHQNAHQIRWLLSEVAMMLGDETVAPVAGWTYDSAKREWSKPKEDTCSPSPK